MNSDEGKFIKIISEAISKVVVPAMEEMEDRLTLKLEESKKKLEMRFDSIDRKLDAQQERFDRQGQTQETQSARLEVLEKIHPKSKHDFVTT